MFKNKLNNYFVNEILKSYFFTLFSLSLLIWVAQAAKYLSLITEAGLSIETYSSYIFLIFPKIISQLIIISFLVSLFISIIKFKENKEIDIYWFSGISKINITALIIKISFFPVALGLFLYVFIVPISNAKSRQLLADSEFSMINSLVKKRNFNSSLKDLTIFVNKNDNKGNIEKIFIFENLKTIIAKTGRVLNINNKNYLELNDGLIHEKNNNNKITSIKFNKTLFDFTKYQTNIVKIPKLQERGTFWLLNEYKKIKNTEDGKNLLYEIHKRFFKPLFIPIISILCCFLLYSNSEKINIVKLKVFIFCLSTVMIVFFEILLNFSTKNDFFQNFLYIAPFAISLILFLILKSFFKNEPIN